MTVRILVGDVMQRLRDVPDGSIRTCVTSPPYWGLRDYGVAGQIGLEPSPEEWCRVLVGVFAEVRRTLAKDGTLWVNVGDSYADGGRGSGAGATLEGSRRNLDETRKVRIRERGASGVKIKDMVGLPWLLAFALRADGWYLRSEVIWHKPNPMPESVKDRPTTAHERIFLFARSRRYFWDQEAAREPLQPASLVRLSQVTLEEQRGSERANGGTRRDRPMKAVVRGSAANGKRPNAGRRSGGRPSGWAGTEAEHRDYWAGDRVPAGRYGSGNKARKDRSDHGGTGDRHTNQAMSVPWEDDGSGRNVRSVWSFPTQPFKGAHFATFPEALPRRCIAMASARGDTVLDPFAGAGTVGLVAERLGRDSVLIELNPAYARLAANRIVKELDQPLLTSVVVE